MAYSRRKRARGARQVALAFPIAPAHLHAATRGVTDYASQHGGWLLTTHGESANLPIDSLRGWKGHGIIAILTSEREARIARQFMARGIPVVTFSSTLPDPRVPRARVDNRAIGRLAAEHLLAKGYRRFGFCGLQGVAYSDDRGQAFIQRIEEAGLRCSSLLSPNTFGARRPWENEIRSLDLWLKTLTPPVGLFAVNDYRGQLVANACRSRGWRVPRDAGILGADNNHVICEFTSPTLSSVDCDWYSVGFRSAQLLDRLMNGATPPREDLLIPPAGVVQRVSTDFRLVDDVRVASALEYIRNHIGEVFGVERLIEASGASRRSLEGAFFEELHCSPYHYLCSQRVAKAKSLLTSRKEMTLVEISRRCGFHDLRRFREVFRRMEGISPAQYRARK